MNKVTALNLLHSKLTNINLRRHCYAVGAVMHALARRLGGDPETWEVVGILHDGDYEQTRNDTSRHTLLMIEWLKEEGVTDQSILSAIRSHNFAHTGADQPSTTMEWALYCCDVLTGFIIAVALVRPDKLLSSVDVESVMKKWPQRAFAAGVDRKQIEACREKLGLDLEEFISIALSAMQDIHEDLGL
jgi:hypothetical protein